MIFGRRHCLICTSVFFLTYQAAEACTSKRRVPILVHDWTYDYGVRSYGIMILERTTRLYFGDDCLYLDISSDTLTLVGLALLAGVMAVLTTFFLKSRS